MNAATSIEIAVGRAVAQLLFDESGATRQGRQRRPVVNGRAESAGHSHAAAPPGRQRPG